QRAVAADQDVGVVNGGSLPLVQPRDQVEPVFPGERAQEPGRSARDRLGHIGVGLPGADDGDPFRQADDVGPLEAASSTRRANCSRLSWLVRELRGRWLTAASLTLRGAGAGDSLSSTPRQTTSPRGA